MAIAVITAYRLATALPVLRWPLAGAVIAILGDLGDLFLINVLPFYGGPGVYQAWDKVWDLFYMGTFLAVSLRWGQPEKGIAGVLFVFRMVGLAAFEVTHARPVLMVFPNVFEFWFMGVATLRMWRGGYKFTWGGVAALIAAATCGKLFQEYALHVGRWLDGFTIFEAIGSIWRWLTPF